MIGLGSDKNTYKDNTKLYVPYTSKFRRTKPASMGMPSEKPLENNKLLFTFNPTQPSAESKNSR